VHLVGFTVGIYYDALTYERQKINCLYQKLTPRSSYQWRSQHIDNKVRAHHIKIMFKYNSFYLQMRLFKTYHFAFKVLVSIVA
jgi:hypothetical protein